VRKLGLKRSLDGKEVDDILHTSTPSRKRLVRSGRLPAYRIGTQKLSYHHTSHLVVTNAERLNCLVTSPPNLDQSSIRNNRIRLRMAICPLSSNGIRVLV
jgi:hypothetical protein